MLLDRDITPEFEQDLRRQQIIIGHSEQEIYKKSKDLNDFCVLHVSATTLGYILRQWKGHQTSWEVLKGLKVLDLGSGSGYSRDFFGQWYPQFSRLCAMNKASVLAIDINPQCGYDRDFFEWEAVDLVEAVMKQELSNLPVLKGRRFDLIHSASFVGHNYCPELLGQLSPYRISVGGFGEAMKQQVGELLEEGGVMDIGVQDARYIPILYTKQEGEVIELTKIPKTD